MPINQGKAAWGNVAVGDTFQRVQVDILGPLTRTIRGNRYILVMTDMFTKWVEAFPIGNIEARTVAGVIVGEFICRYGSPQEIHTDQGRQFEAVLFKEICVLLGIAKSRSTPYHPQANGQVERFNRTLLSMLSQWGKEKPHDWDIFLPLVMLAYRSSCHEVTRYSPHYLLFGREIRLPIDVQYPTPGNQLVEGQNEAVLRLKKNLLEAHEKVRENLETFYARQKENYGKEKGVPLKFKVGDQVWLFEKNCKPGRCSKFHRPWVGPYQISKLISDLVVEITLLNQKRRSKIIVHVDRLKPFINLNRSDEELKKEIGNLDTGEPKLQDKSLHRHSSLTRNNLPLQSPLRVIDGDSTLLSPEPAETQGSRNQLSPEPAESSLGPCANDQQEQGEIILSGENTEGGSIVEEEAERYPTRIRRPLDRYQAGCRRYPLRIRKPPDRFQP